MRRVLSLLTPLLLAAGSAGAETPPLDAWQELLSRDAVGARTFTEAHPTWDGRGVVIAVLDTGVDPSVPGLRKTSTGERKVVETRDFSGEGDVDLARAWRAVEDDGVAVLRTKEGFVRGFEGLGVKPRDGVYWLGFFRESQLKHSSVQDVDRDGSADDSFAVVAFRPEGSDEAVAVVDTDGDGDLAGEEVRRSYRRDPRFFAFTHPDPRKDQTPIAFTLTVFPGGERKVEMHFDDGGHGTHVSGIAAGHGIQGREGFDGVAPGARIMSLKIGDNTLAGGATRSGSMKRAMEYAGRWSAQHDVPVVMNISYGIGSELEGTSDIDRALDGLLSRYPLLMASVSAGNKGPGLSTVGTPAASARAWTAGALLLPDAAEALWGGGVDRMRVFGFSSRGGELAKPDGMTPGVAWSTVPPFLQRPVMAGTSMAAPQATGVHALLVSAALDTDTPWNSDLVKRALRATAEPVEGYTTLDQGAGLVQVGPAWEALRDAAPEARTEVLLGWDVSTGVPHRPGSEGTASYWRTGDWVPDYPHTVDVSVEPAFLETATDAARTRFFTRLSLDSNAGWVRLDRRRLTFRGGRPQRLSLRLSPEAVRKPGLHVAHITARAEDGLPAFTLPVTVVTPWTFRTKESRHRRFSGRLEPGAVERHFLEVPAGATELALALRTPEGRFGRTYLRVFDPEGRQVDVPQPVASSEDGREAEFVVKSDRFRPGVWEVVPYATFRNQEPSAWELDAGFVGLEAAEEVAYDVPGSGGLEATWTVTNRFDVPLRGTIRGAVVGPRRTEELEIEGAEERLGIPLLPGTEGATLRLEMTREHYNEFTDVAVNVLDPAGDAVAQTGFTTRFAEVSFTGSPGDYTLQIVAASSDPLPARSEPLEWTVRVEEVQRFAEPPDLAVRTPDGRQGEVVLYPGVPTRLSLSTPHTPPQLPMDYHLAAEIAVSDRLAEDQPPIVKELSLIR
ncbi:MAG: S8 family serine peptidase [Myxococcota bacterium]